MALKRLYVLVSHEPKQDPRIDWVSRFAVDRFDVRVFGIASPARLEAEFEKLNGYEIERLQRTLDGVASFAWECRWRFLITPISWLVLFGAASVLLLLLPFLVMLKVARMAYRLLVPKSLRSILRGQVFRTVDSPIFPAFLRWPDRVFFPQLGRFRWLLWHFAATSATLSREIQNQTKPDLLYCNDLDTLLGGVVLKALFGCKLVYDAHEFWAHSDPASPWWEVRFFLFLEKRLLREVDAAFTVNPLLAKQMELALGFPFGSLPNCEPLLPLASDTDSRPRRDAFLSLSDRKRVIEEAARGRVRFLFQGLFAPERGLEEFLQAWRRVDSEKAVLFLQGPDNEIKALCMEQANQLGVLNKSVFFLAPVLEDELVAAACEADVGIIPYKAVNINYRYCCPNKLAQFMHAGLAILANDLHYVRAVVEKYQCGLTFRIDDETCVLDAINRFIHDGPLRRACQTQAKKMAVSEFHWEHMSRQLYDTCARLAGLEMEIAGNETVISRVA